MNKSIIMLSIWAIAVFTGTWKILDVTTLDSTNPPVITDQPMIDTPTTDTPTDTTPAPSEVAHIPTERPQATTQSGKDYAPFFTDGIQSVAGNVQWGFTNYNTDASYKSASCAVPSASVIKVFIMEYIYANRLNLQENVGGKTISSLIESMITISDNTATNTLIDHIGMNTLNSYFQSQGYNDTRLERRMLDTQAQAAGKENYTSINDVMAFLDKMYHNKSVSPYSQMLDTMKRQQRRTKIPAKIPAGVVIANKTGELSNVENDIGIIFTAKGDFAIAFLCTSLAVPGDARNYISNTTLSVYNEFLKQ